jgi:hypothetical protein
LVSVTSFNVPAMGFSLLVVRLSAPLTYTLYKV